MRVCWMLCCLGTLALWAGCATSPDDETPTPPVCDADDAGRPSLTLTVADVQGAALPGASVTWSVDGSAYRAAACVDGGALETCTHFSVGFEQAGDFTVRVERTGYVAQEQTVTVGRTADGCHVETQTLDFRLETVEEPCGGDAAVSVVASVVDGDGAPLPGATVTWRVNGSTAQEAICTDDSSPEACATFRAGVELTGEFVVRAEKAGYQAAEVTTTVGMTEDGCHVVTEEVTLTLVETVTCPGEPQPSVFFNVMDDVTWKYVLGATVTWSVDGGPFMPAECFTGEPLESCTAFVAGWDLPGEIVIRASAAGYLEQEKTVLISLDETGCRAETQYTELRLTPLAQTPSVKVKVTDPSGAPLPGARLTWQNAGGEVREADCADDVSTDHCTEFVAGWNLVGEFTLWAEREGYQSLEVSTSVGWDEEDCEPITSQLELRLLPLGM